MMEPRYRDVKSNQIPEVTQDSGTKIRIICGKAEGQQGPVRDIVIDPEYLDVIVPAALNSPIRPSGGIRYLHTSSTEKGISARRRNRFPMTWKAATISI